MLHRVNSAVSTNQQIKTVDLLLAVEENTDVYLDYRYGSCTIVSKPVVVNNKGPLRPPARPIYLRTNALKALSDIERDASESCLVASPCATDVPPGDVTRHPTTGWAVVDFTKLIVEVIKGHYHS